VRLAADVSGDAAAQRPQMKPFDVAAHYAELRAGRDFYDFMNLRAPGILIGDVVGKGVAAALLMSSVRSSIRAHAQTCITLMRCEPDEQALAADTLDNDCDGVVRRVDRQSLRLTVLRRGARTGRCWSGCEGPQGGSKDVQRLTADGMALGRPEPEYPKGMFQMGARGRAGGRTRMD